MNPYMPAVDPKRDLRRCFALARPMSAGLDTATDGIPGRRSLVIITPGGLLLKVPCPREDVKAEMVRDVENVLGRQANVGASTGRVITVVACTDVVNQRTLKPDAMMKLVPFLGYLVGMAYVGNQVVAFEGHPDGFAAGCKGADLLIVDGGMVPFLQPDWAEVALSRLNQPSIIQFGRDGGLGRLDRLVKIDKPNP